MSFRTSDTVSATADIPFSFDFLFRNGINQMRFHFFLSLAIFLSVQLKAQIQKEFICNEGVGYGAVQTADHGYFFYGAVDDGSYSAALSGMWVKTDSLGNILWSKKSGAFMCYEEDVKLISTADSGVTIALNVLDNFGDYNWTCLFHLDAFGNVIWHNSFYMSDASTMTNLEITNNGYLISGYTSAFSLVLINTDQNGNINWGRSLTFNTGVYNSDAIKISNGNILSCSSLSGGSLLVKLDSAGNVLSSTLYRDTLYELPNGILNNAGEIIIYGSKSISAQPNLRNAYATAIDSSGNVIWSKTYSEGMISEFFNATVDQTGNFLFAGRGANLSSHLYPLLGVTANANGDTLKTNYLLTDIWGTNSKPVFDNSGNFTYAGYINDTILHPVLTSISFQNDCNMASTGIVVSGSTDYTDSIIPFTTDTIVHIINDSIITQQISISNIDLCTLLNIENSSSEELNIYPNPASTILHIDADKPIPLRLFDVQGRLYKYDSFYSEKKLFIDVSTLENGAYFLQNENTGKANLFLKLQQ